MKFGLALGAMVAALCLNASPAAAAPDSPAQAAGPTACLAPGATTPAEYVGTWIPRQHDDGYDWVDIAPHVFARDGTFSETTTSQGVQYGHWCVQGGQLIWGFDGTTRTTYRVALNQRQSMSGFMSWDGGGTGEVEIRRGN
ncbi:MAG: hypothetical protein NT015_10945 [Alphaproteobacteria bacterium]|nr:hypothetical protein [Alphaproteobacteria bacterium]